MSKKKPRHKAATMRYSFADAPDMPLQLVELTAQMIIQYARMAESDNPASRAKGREQIRMIAEFCVAGQFSLDDQGKKSKVPRGTIETDEGRFSVAGVARRLAAQHPELKAPALWSYFIAELDRRGLHPREIVEINKRGEKVPAVEHEAPTKDDPDRRKVTTMNTWSKAVSDAMK